MINPIDKLFDCSPSRIREFIQGCVIEEKLDTHYISVEIISKNEIKIKKANGNEIDRVDLILNSMWTKLFLDWNYLKLSNKEWFETHIGYTIKMFYFPCDTPILTTYNSNIRYIFDIVIFNNVKLDPKEVLSSIEFPDVYNIDYKCNAVKIEKPYETIKKCFDEISKSEHVDKTPSDIIKTIVDKDKSKLFATSEPEGFIFRYNNRIYQTVNTPSKVEQEKASYEFLLADFIKFCKTHNYTEKINQSYTKTVCNLFNDYIINGEKVSHTIEKNIEISSIEPPYLGQKFEIGYEYIPDQVTKTLCQESELYKNIFKVLLANLRRGKDIKHCIFLNKKAVDDWNNITKSIKIRNIYI